MPTQSPYTAAALGANPTTSTTLVEALLNPLNPLAGYPGGAMPPAEPPPQPTLMEALLKINPRRLGSMEVDHPSKHINRGLAYWYNWLRVQTGDKLDENNPVGIEHEGIQVLAVGIAIMGYHQPLYAKLTQEEQCLAHELYNKILAILRQDYNTITTHGASAYQTIHYYASQRQPQPVRV